MKLPPPDALVPARPLPSGNGPDLAGSWTVEARFKPDGQPDSAELDGVLDMGWRARHHHPSLWTPGPLGWRPLQPQVGAATPRLLLRWALCQPDVDPPTERDLEGRLGAVEQTLQQLAPCELVPSLPLAVAAERAKALSKLRRTWGTPVYLRLVGGPRGIDGAGAWFHLRDLGLTAGEDGWLRYGLPDAPDHPPAFTVGTSGPPGRLDPTLLTQGETRLTDLVLRFVPALCPRPARLLDVLLELANQLATSLGARVLTTNLKEVSPATLHAQVALVQTGLQRHGFQAGNSATVSIFGKI